MLPEFASGLQEEMPFPSAMQQLKSCSTIDC